MVLKSVRKIWVAAIIVATSCFGLVACDDDEDYGHNNYVWTYDMGVFSDDMGHRVRLTAFDNMQIYYDRYGAVTSIGGIDFDVRDMVIVEKEEWDDYYLDIVNEYDVDRYGYILSKRSSLIEEDRNNGEEYVENTKYDYNQNGMLSSIRGVTTGSLVEHGVRIPYNGIRQVSFFYDGDLLQKIVVRIEVDYADGAYTEKVSENVFYYDEELANYYYQYTPSVTELFTDTDFDQCLAIIGMYGSASYMLPSFVGYFDYKTENGHKTEEEGEIECRYRFFSGTDAIAVADGYEYEYDGYNRSLNDEECESVSIRQKHKLPTTRDVAKERVKEK